MVKNIGEDKCECGFSIPRGYGYYNYGKRIKCFQCGRINQKHNAWDDYCKKNEYS